MPGSRLEFRSAPPLSPERSGGSCAAASASDALRNVGRTALRQGKLLGFSRLLGLITAGPAKSLDRLLPADLAPTRVPCPRWNCAAPTWRNGTVNRQPIPTVSSVHRHIPATLNASTQNCNAAGGQTGRRQGLRRQSRLSGKADLYLSPAPRRAGNARPMIAKVRRPRQD